VGGYQEQDGATLEARLSDVFEVFPRLRERIGQLAGTMSGGEQAMLSIGRGLMAAPKLLIIDEPSLGLSPLYVKENFNVIRRINDTGVTVLLVEQNVSRTLAIADRGDVLAQGRIAASGDAAVLRDDPEVQQAYFGRK
jgi:branched-chain amino acid transport system ATP-binding protein